MVKSKPDPGNSIWDIWEYEIQQQTNKLRFVGIDSLLFITGKVKINYTISYSLEPQRS